MTAGDERLLFDGVAESTLASTWLRLTGHPIDDDLLQWPPDVFALTDVLLERAEGFRFVLSPPAGAVWPPDRFADWGEAVGEAAQQWSRLAEDRDDPLPELVVEEWSVIRDASATPLEQVADGGHWRVCEALLTLHAVADEACAGLFVALDRSDGQGCRYRARGREVLARTGSLARIRPQLLRVLPKSERHRLGGRRSHATPASLAQGSPPVGTSCRFAIPGPTRKPSTSRCCCCHGR